MTSPADSRFLANDDHPAADLRPGVRAKEDERSNPGAVSFARRLPSLGLLGLIRVYQRFVSPVLPVVFGSACGCRFAPTCSHFAADSVRTHGALRGSWLALRRLTRCHPWHPGGLDPVPTKVTAPRCARIAPLSSSGRG